MPKPVVHTTTTFEDQGKVLMARVVGEDAANVLQADITGISFKVFEQSDLTDELQTGNLTVSSVIFDTLQTDSRWVNEETGVAIDTVGYNFRTTAPGTWFSGAPKIYVVEFLFDPSSGEDFFVKFLVSTLRIETS